MQFSAIKGQDAALHMLQQSLANGHLAHGYLFSGPQGVGKEMAALAVGQYLNCQHPNSVTFESCNQCPSCIKMRNLEHPDLIKIIPDGQAIKIEQIRQLNMKVALRSYEGAYKIVIIDEAHLMTTEAANSLLKTLEEPADQTLFILISAQPQRLPATILSRCQQLSFNPLPATIIKQILENHYPHLQSQLGLIATLSRGSVKKAQDMLESESILTIRQALYDHLSHLPHRSPSQILEWCEQWDKDRQMVRTIIELCQLWFRDHLIWQTTQHSALLINQDYLTILTAQTLSIQSVIQILQTMNISLQQLEYNTSPRLVLEVLLLKTKQQLS